MDCMSSTLPGLQIVEYSLTLTQGTPYVSMCITCIGDISTEVAVILVFQVLGEAWVTAGISLSLTIAVPTLMLTSM